MFPADAPALNPREREHGWTEKMEVTLPAGPYHSRQREVADMPVVGVREPAVNFARDLGICCSGRIRD